MKLKLLFIMLMLPFGLSAQTDYYWYRDKKVILERIPFKKFILIQDEVSDSNALKAMFPLENISVHTFGETRLLSGLNNKPSTSKEKKWAVVSATALKSLSQNKSIVYESSFYLTPRKSELGISHIFYVKLKKEEDLPKLKAHAKSKNVEILGNNKLMPTWYTLEVSKKSKGTALEMANFFYETKQYSASEPDLMVDNLAICANDPYFPNQWGLSNTGQSGGTTGIDIKVCSAWTISTGNSGIVLAVLDQGIELNHPDLTHMSPVSFDTETNMSPSQVRGNHGTATAGIAGATTNNNLGVAGIAPISPLMSISNALLLAPGVQQQLANGLNFAWQNGAAVINNSWGHDALTSSLIDDAISNALTLGRGGLGTIVVFATGNNNGAVSYPANSNSAILAVGAISQCGQRKSPSSCDGENWGSNYGTTLDIVAPGVLIPTTDRQGVLGYNTSPSPIGDYYQSFNGTSSATPHVAGVAALVLSVNPTLTRQQVSDIIETTAQKIGGYSYTTHAGRTNGTWNNEMGYGLLDAYAAVLAASGGGSCTTVTPPVNIINQNFTSNATFSGCNYFVQNVNVSSGAELRINKAGYVQIDGTFDVAMGSELYVQ